MWARADVTVTGAPEPFVEVVASPDVQEPGGTVVYDITYGNQGNLDLAGAELGDLLPEQVTYVSSDPAGTYDSAGHKVVWSGLDLPAGSVQQATVTVTIEPDVAPGTQLLNRVSLEGSGLPAATAEVTHLVAEPGQTTIRLYLPIVTRNW